MGSLMKLLLSLGKTLVEIKTFFDQLGRIWEKLSDENRRRLTEFVKQVLQARGLDARVKQARAEAERLAHEASSASDREMTEAFFQRATKLESALSVTNGQTFRQRRLGRAEVRERLDVLLLDMTQYLLGAPLFATSSPVAGAEKSASDGRAAKSEGTEDSASFVIDAK